MVIQERDRVIKELEEKVAFLEAEASTAGTLPVHGDQRVAQRERRQRRRRAQGGSLIFSRADYATMVFKVP